MVACNGQLHDEYRAPWHKPYVIGIAGASGSGKTTLAGDIKAKLQPIPVHILQLDHFYKVLDAEQSKRAFRDQYDFDAPDALDWNLIYAAIKRAVVEGKATFYPDYDFSSHARTQKINCVHGAPILIVEGIHALFPDWASRLYDIKVFVRSDMSKCMVWRLLRDTRERGRTPNSIITQFRRFVEPAYKMHVAPLEQSANIVISSHDAQAEQVAEIAEKARQHYQGLNDALDTFKHSILRRETYSPPRIIGNLSSDNISTLEDLKKVVLKCGQVNTWVQLWFASMNRSKLPQRSCTIFYIMDPKAAKALAEVVLPIAETLNTQCAVLSCPPANVTYLAAPNFVKQRMCNATKRYRVKLITPAFNGWEMVKAVSCSSDYFQQRPNLSIHTYHAPTRQVEIFHEVEPKIYVKAWSLE